MSTQPPSYLLPVCLDRHQPYTYFLHVYTDIHPLSQSLLSSFTFSSVLPLTGDSYLFVELRNRKKSGSLSSDQFKQTTAPQGPLTLSRPIPGYRLPWHVDVPFVCSYRTSPVFWPPWSSIATSDLFGTRAPAEQTRSVTPDTSWKSFLLTRKEQER